MKDSTLLLFRLANGIVAPMTEDEYKEFVENRDSWEDQSRFPFFPCVSAFSRVCVCACTRISSFRNRIRKGRRDELVYSDQNPTLLSFLFLSVVV